VTLGVGDSFIERVKLGVADTAKSFLIDMWLARHTPEKVLPILYNVIDAANSEFADAISSGGGIYAVGYCFGAKYGLLLGGTTSAEESEEEQVIKGVTPRTHQHPLVKAVAVAHGTQIVPSDISSLKVPTCLICVEKDPLFPDDVRKKGVEILEKSRLEHEVKVYPEVPHGFAVVGDYEDAKIKDAQQTAFDQMLGWLQAH